MNCKIVTHWDGVLHILRNPHGFSEDVVRRARLDAADCIEALRRDAERYRKWRAADRASTADTFGEVADWHMQLALAETDSEFDAVIDTLPPLTVCKSEGQ